MCLFECVVLGFVCRKQRQLEENACVGFYATVEENVCMLE